MCRLALPWAVCRFDLYPGENDDDELVINPNSMAAKAGGNGPFADPLGRCGYCCLLWWSVVLVWLCHGQSLDAGMGVAFYSGLSTLWFVGRHWDAHGHSQVVLVRLADAEIPASLMGDGAPLDLAVVVNVYGWR